MAQHEGGHVAAGEPLRVLIVEDRSRDATLLVQELERAGFAPQWERVDTEQDYRRALAFERDVILADGTLPQFDALRALTLLQELGLTTPVVVVTGSLSDERAVEFMKHGAADYLLKDRLARLGQAVRQAIDAGRRVEDARRVEEERQRLFDLSIDMVCVASVDGYFKILNPAWEATLGWRREELLGRPYLDFVHPDDRAATATRADELARGGRTAAFENRYRCTSGSYKWLSWRSTSDPASGLIYATARDMTERRRADEAVRLRDRAIQAVSQGILITDASEPDCPIIFAGPGFSRLTGYAADEVIGRNCRFLRGPDSDPAAVAALRDAVRDGRPCTVEVLNYRKDGTTFWNEVSLSPVRDDDGRLRHFVGVQTDVTERRRVAEEIREWRDRYAAAVKATGQILYEWEPVSDAAVYAGNVEGILGYSAAELEGGLTRRLDLVHADDRDALATELERARRTGDRLLQEYRVRRKDGTIATVRDVGHFVSLHGSGGERMVGLIADMSEQRRLEEQLRQAQKMDAFGQLAGGVAHDFNNLLTIINAYSDMLLDELGRDDPLRELVAEIHRAGQRSAALTRQLLAFSRRQVIAPRVLDLHDVVIDMEKLLRRLIGEDVRLRVILAPTLWPIRADPGQVEQVVLNLVVNARDAMPRGGTLTIETANQQSEPGRFVRLSVTDTGCGMDAGTLKRIFEPFFTTKGDEGTGLGLATVYGIVEQAGGHIEVESEPGRGTTFTVYFPATVERARSSRPTHSGRPMPGGEETILVAEDDDGVRALTVRVLKRCGYTVLEARNGAEAVEIAARLGPPLHLLVTDVVMPGSGGREAADRVVALHPETRVLFLSGYTDDAVIRHGVQHAETAFLQKPFTPAALAQRIRDLLDGEGWRGCP